MMPSFAAKRRPPQSALARSTDGTSDRLEKRDQFDPTPTLDRPGGSLGVQKIVPSVTGLRFSEP